MSQPISLGAVVQLKSGGPLMTADTYVSDAGVWTCVWFETAEDGRQTLRQARFGADSLKVVENPPGERVGGEPVGG